MTSVKFTFAVTSGVLSNAELYILIKSLLAYSFVVRAGLEPAWQGLCPLLLPYVGFFPTALPIMLPNLLPVFPSCYHTKYSTMNTFCTSKADRSIDTSVLYGFVESNHFHSQDRIQTCKYKHWDSNHSSLISRIVLEPEPVSIISAT